MNSSDNSKNCTNGKTSPKRKIDEINNNDNDIDYIDVQEQSIHERVDNPTKKQCIQDTISILNEEEPYVPTLFISAHGFKRVLEVVQQLIGGFQTVFPVLQRGEKNNEPTNLKDIPFPYMQSLIQFENDSTRKSDSFEVTTSFHHFDTNNPDIIRSSENISGNEIIKELTDIQSLFDTSDDYNDIRRRFITIKGSFPDWNTNYKRIILNPFLSNSRATQFDTGSLCNKSHGSNDHFIFVCPTSPDYIESDLEQDIDDLDTFLDDDQKYESIIFLFDRELDEQVETVMNTIEITGIDVMWEYYDDIHDLSNMKNSIKDFLKYDV